MLVRGRRKAHAGVENEAQSENPKTFKTAQIQSSSTQSSDIAMKKKTSSLHTQIF
jgi:hypothetical protein